MQISSIQFLKIKHIKFQLKVNFMTFLSLFLENDGKKFLFKIDGFFLKTLQNYYYFLFLILLMIFIVLYFKLSLRFENISFLKIFAIISICFLNTLNNVYHENLLFIIPIFIISTLCMRIIWFNALFHFEFQFKF